MKPNELLEWRDFVASAHTQARDAWEANGHSHPPLALVFPREVPDDARAQACEAVIPAPGVGVHRWLEGIRHHAKQLNAAYLLVVAETNVSRFESSAVARVVAAEVKRHAAAGRAPELGGQPALLMHVECADHVEVWIAYKETIVQPGTNPSIQVVEERLSEWLEYKGDDGESASPFAKLIG